jgi:phenylpropionate dioxygenase-like ring-hydroxylating dioxygenase large terminal subunit
VTFIKNSWYVAGHAGEIGNVPIARRVLGQPVLLYRLSSGEPAALLDRCPHRKVPLSAGRRCGDDIQCGYHGLRFGPDGTCLSIPGQRDIPFNANATPIAVIDRNDLTWVWMGEAKLADPNLIPVFPWLSNPDWTSKCSTGYLRIAANHQLLTDNLLDLSHETYVHERTIGNVEEHSIAEYPAETTVQDRQILRAHREMSAIAPPPFFAMILNTDRPIDRWQTAVFATPTINMTESGAYRHDEPRGNAAMARVLHLLTPETETSTHYFWIVSRNYRVDDEALGAAIGQAIVSTFDEDRSMLELQQAALTDEAGPVPGFALVVDRAPILARRMYAERLMQEQAGKVSAPPCMVADEAATPAMKISARNLSAG